jgi:hypothetical protein
MDDRLRQLEREVARLGVSFADRIVARCHDAEGG